ncbi:MAG: hypothetical protein V1845_02445 [bacterium]
MAKQMTKEQISFFREEIALAVKVMAEEKLRKLGVGMENMYSDEYGDICRAASTVGIQIADVTARIYREAASRQ